MWFKLVGESSARNGSITCWCKYPPWQFSGVGKVGPMMKWIHAQAAIPFELPNLPHLTPEQRELYKTQVREREEIRAQKRAQEQADMDAADALRAETRQRNARRERLQELGEAQEIWKRKGKRRGGRGRGRGRGREQE